MNAGMILVQRLRSLEDPRVTGRCDHALTDILLIVLCATMAGAEGWDDMEAWGEANEERLRLYVELRNGIPGHDTIRRVFEAIDPKRLEAVLLEWVGQVCPALEQFQPDWRQRRVNLSAHCGIGIAFGGRSKIMSWHQGQAYGQDLRDRVLNASGSIREVAQRFDVSKSYVARARSRRKRWSEDTPGVQCNHVPPKLNGLEQVLAAQVEAVPDLTLKQLCQWMQAVHGVQVSIAVMWKTLARLGLRLKKSHSMPPSRNART